MAVAPQIWQRWQVIDYIGKDRRAAVATISAVWGWRVSRKSASIAFGRFPPPFFVGGARRCAGLRFESLRQATGSALPAVQMIAILPARTLALYTLYTHFCISIPPLSHSALLRWGDPVQSPVFALNFVEFQGSKPNLSGIEFRPTRATPQCAATWPGLQSNRSAIASQAARSTCPHVSIRGGPSLPRGEGTLLIGWSRYLDFALRGVRQVGVPADQDRCLPTRRF